MSKKVTITCDSCKQDFEITSADLKNRMSGEILFRYMVCPHCETVYMISATDKEYRKLPNGITVQKKRKEMQEVLNNRYRPLFTRLFPKAYVGQPDADSTQKEGTDK